MMKSDSRVVGQQFEHLHPRMIYEIINHIKFQGKIDSSEIVDILGKFSDLNTSEVIKSDKNADTKFMKYSLEALKETVGRHESGRF